MPLRSMTGYGRGEASARGTRVEVELSAVNRRQFDVRFGLPKALSALESRAVELIHNAVSRGYVTGTARITLCETARSRAACVDKDAAARLVRQLRRTASELGMKDDLSASALLALPDVVRHPQSDDSSEAVWPLLRRALKHALKELTNMRKVEGAALAKDLRARQKTLLQRLAHIKKLTPAVPRRHRAALAKRLKAAGVVMGGQDSALLRELALFADRSDVTEEVVRLESHLAQVREHLNAAKPVGRTLDFLCQEIFREINTIGSKANDAAISKHVITFKAEVEAVREQVQNIE